MALGFDQDGNYVWPDGTVTPGPIAQAAGFGAPEEPTMSPDPMMSMPEPQPTTTPGNWLGAPQPEQPPQPGNWLAGEVVQPGQPLPAPQAAPAPGKHRAPQPQLPPEERAHQQRVDRTVRQVGSLRGLNQALGENVEFQTDHLGAGAELTAQAARQDAGDQTQAFLDARKVDLGREEAVRLAHQEMNRRTMDIDRRAAQYQQELDNFEMDPQRVFRRQSGWTNLADIVGVGLGALVQAGSPNGVNTALALLHKKVDDDMKVQQDRRDMVMDLYKNLPQELQYVRSVYDNEVSADATERAAKYAAIENLLKAKMAQTSNVRVKAALEMARADIYQKRIDNMEKARSSAQAIALKSMEIAYAREQAKAKAAEKQYYRPAAGNLYIERTVAGPDGKPMVVKEALPQGANVAPLDDKTKLAVDNKFGLTKSLLGAKANLEALGLTGPKVLDKHTPFVQQQVEAIIVSQITGSNARSITDKDAEYIARSLGLPGDHNPDSIRSWILQQSGDGLLTRLNAAALANQEQGLDLLTSHGQLPTNARFRIEGVEVGASPVIEGYVAAQNRTPAEKASYQEDEAFKQLRSGQPSGFALLEQNFLNPEQRERRKGDNLPGQLREAVLRGTVAATTPEDRAKFLRAQPVVEQVYKVEDLRRRADAAHTPGVLRTKDYDALVDQLDAETAALQTMIRDLRH